MLTGHILFLDPVHKQVLSEFTQLTSDMTPVFSRKRKLLTFILLNLRTTDCQYFPEFRTKPAVASVGQATKGFPGSAKIYWTWDCGFAIGILMADGFKTLQFLFLSRAGLAVARGGSGDRGGHLPVIASSGPPEVLW